MISAAFGEIRAITLDMYGTLLDLEPSFVQGFGSFLKEKGTSRDAAEVIQIWEAVYLRESMVDTMLGRGRTLFDTPQSSFGIPSQFLSNWRLSFLS